MKKGLVHIYTGNGKGKTTAAIGLALRCSGRGYKVGVTSFMKNFDSGEYLTDVPFDIFRFEGMCGFWNEFSKQEKEIKRAVARNHLDKVFKTAINGKYDMLVLDEIIVAINLGCILEKDVVDFIKNRPYTLEVVLTGANPTDNLIAIADYISEIKSVKHPYDKGIPAREGIEY